MQSAKDLRESVFDLGAQRRNLEMIGSSYPALFLRCDRQFSPSSRLLVAEAVLALRDLCEIDLFVLLVKSGCIEVQIGLQSHTDAWRRDFRHLFWHSENYHAFNFAYDVRRIVFHRFPREDNFSSPMIFDRTGRPAILAR